MRSRSSSDIKTELYYIRNRVLSKHLPNSFEHITRNRDIALVFTLPDIKKKRLISSFK